MSEQARLDNYAKEASLLGLEIEELRRLLKASDAERNDLRNAASRWEQRVDSLIRAIELMGESR